MDVSKNETIERCFPNLIEILAGRTVLEITLYGSSLRLESEGNKDVDLFVVLEGENKYKRQIVGNLDVVALGTPEACRLAKSFDPLVTEPVLTGRKLAGCSVVDRAVLESGTVPHTARKHLLLRAKEVLGWTISSSGGLREARDLLETGISRNIIDNLSYVTSYLAFCAHYSRSPRVLTLKRLIQTYPESPVATLRGMKRESVVRKRITQEIFDELVYTLSHQSVPNYNWVLGAPTKSLRKEVIT